jgi:hypothetical protein
MYNIYNSTVFLILVVIREVVFTTAKYTQPLSQHKEHTDKGSAQMGRGGEQ